MLRILITKRTDGGAVLKCTRADGTETWQKQEGTHATFFPLHDLTHYSVESELGLTHAFFGLIDQGWSITDTEGRGPRGHLPSDAQFGEWLVGQLDAERASSARWTTAEFMENAERYFGKAGIPVPRVLTDDELWRIRKRRAELFERWHALVPGDTLELTFASASTSGAPAASHVTRR
ncbi:MAG TPA: hypothetical protein VKH19_02525 [Gemmatimonadaceae bacterium]|nr:hypothetical protein [Gemmatimonadaceae bacterium]